jgi:predicted Zn-dependent protease
MPDSIGNSFSTATLIQTTPGKYSFDRTEQVGSSDPLDIYKFTLAGKSSFSAAAVDLTGDVSLTLYSGTNAIATSNSNSSKGSETLSADLAAGTYYLQISANNSSISDYRLLFETQSTPKANVVWRNVVSGVNAAWQLNGGAIAGVETYTPITDPSWTMVGVSDFNGDGQTDYLWRQASTGTTAIWEMNGSSIGRGYYLPTLYRDWSVNLATDFNSDGKGDILWQNADGRNMVWYMDGGGTVSSGENLLAVADRNWRMEAAGDFNYDGTTDLLWRNYASGENVAWLMNGSQIAGVMNFLTINDRSWTIEGAGDFNDDGKVDLLWHHTSGLNVTWNLNGNAIASSTTLMPIADPNWQIMGVGRRFETPLEADLPGSIANLALNLGDITGLIAGGSVRVGGSVNSNSDATDLYRFTLTSSTTVDMSLDSSANGVTLISPQGVPMQQGSSLSHSLQAGTYYLRVNAASSNKANYFLNLTAKIPLQSTTNFTQPLNPGGSYSITWQDTLTENVKLELYRNGVFDSTIDSSTASDGQFTWLAPPAADGGGYQIRISSVNDSTISAFTGAFAIANPNVIKYNFTYYYNGSDTTADYYNGWVYGDEGAYTVNSWIDPNTAVNETGVNGRYVITSSSVYGPRSGLGGDRGKVFTSIYYDMDRSDPTAYTPNSALRNIAAGTNYLGSEFADFNTGGMDFDFGRDSAEFDAKPDLVVNTVDVVQTQANAGGSLTISWRLQNRSNQSMSAGYRGAIYLSKDSNITTADYQLAIGDFGALGANSSTQVYSGNFVLPSASSTWWSGNGTYYIGFIADVNNTIAESSETNNANRGQGIDWDSFVLTAPPVITVGSPNGNNLWRPGSNVQITWNDNIAENVKIELYKGGSLWEVITTGVASNGLYNWTVTPNIAAGTDYQIKISSVNNSSISDWSDSYFSIKRDIKKYWFIYNYNADNYRSADSYVGSVIAEDGKYTITPKNADGSYNSTAAYDYYSGLNEIGLNGKYAITNVTEYDDNLVSELGRVFVETYWNRSNGVETAYTPIKYSQGIQPSGLNYLGSELDYIGATQSQNSQFGQDYYEAEPRRDIDIQIFDPLGAFNSWQWQAMNIAIENWEKLITIDKSTTGLFKIVVTKDSLSMNNQTWGNNVLAEAYVDSSANYRQNISYASVDLYGTDYDNRVNWNAYNFGPLDGTHIISTMMHEVGHALGLDHEDGNSNSLMYWLSLDNQTVSETTMSTLEAQGYSVDRNMLNQIRWTY